MILFKSGSSWKSWPSSFTCEKENGAQGTLVSRGLTHIKDPPASYTLQAKRFARRVTTPHFLEGLQTSGPFLRQVQGLHVWQGDQCFSKLQLDKQGRQVVLHLSASETIAGVGHGVHNFCNFSRKDYPTKYCYNILWNETNKWLVLLLSFVLMLAKHANCMSVSMASTHQKKFFVPIIMKIFLSLGHELQCE